jgi:hypothetical protein
MITYSELSTKFNGTNCHAFWYPEGVYAYNGLSGSSWAYTAQPDGTFSVATSTENTALLEKALLEDKQLARMMGKG